MKIIVRLVFLFSVFSVQAQPYKLRGVVEGISSGITCLVSNEMGDEVMAGDQSGNMYRVGIDGRIEQRVRGHATAIRGFAFNSTGRLLLSYAAHDLKIWNASTLKAMHALDQQEYADIRFGVFSIADGFIYFNSGSRLYKTRSDLSQAVMRLYDFTESITGGVITPDRSVLIFSAGNKLPIQKNTRRPMVLCVETPQFSIA